jgi:putative membrane protein
MMLWYDHNVSVGGWIVMSISMVLFWALVIGVGAMLFRAFARSSDSAAQFGGPSGLAPVTCSNVVADDMPGAGSRRSPELRSRVSSGSDLGGTPAGTGRPFPEQLLAERFARGEIDEGEYRQCLAVLRGSGPLAKHG